MQYPIFLHKDSNETQYGIIVPDLPGCFSTGSTIEDAIENAHEAISCHLEGLLLDNDPIPSKYPIEYHLQDAEFKDCVLALVDIDMSKISGKAKRINITLPERFLNQIDEYAKQHGGNRSAFLADAAMSFMAGHRPANRL